LFPPLGRDYQTTDLSAGFTGSFPRYRADRDRKHDRRHQALRPVTQRLHHSSAVGKLDKASKQLAQIISNKQLDGDHIDNVEKKAETKRCESDRPDRR
jgi:hypothetical protein